MCPKTKLLSIQRVSSFMTVPLSFAICTLFFFTTQAKAQGACMSDSQAGVAQGSSYGPLAQGNYDIQNDPFGHTGITTWSQSTCLTDNTGTNAWTSTWNWESLTGYGVLSYPSIYNSWNYGTTPASTSIGFPIPISAAHELPTTVTFTMTASSSTYDAAYDIFLSPCQAMATSTTSACLSPNSSTSPAPPANAANPYAEVMVWLNAYDYGGTVLHVPAGEKIATNVSLGSNSWDVYAGSGGGGGGRPNWPLYIFVLRGQAASNAQNTFTGNLLPFLSYLNVTNNYLTQDAYILGVFFGVEVRSNENAGTPNSNNSVGSITVSNFHVGVDSY